MGEVHREHAVSSTHFNILVISYLETEAGRGRTLKVRLSDVLTNRQVRT